MTIPRFEDEERKTLLAKIKEKDGSLNLTDLMALETEDLQGLHEFKPTEDES